MLENLIVGLIVAVAAWYAARRLLPPRLRARLFGKAAAGQGDCDSACGSCGGCEPAPPLELDAKASSGSAGQGPTARAQSARGDAAQPGRPGERMMESPQRVLERRVIRLHPVPAR